MTSHTDDGQDKLMVALLDLVRDRQDRRPSSALPVTAIVLAACALGLSGFSAFVTLSDRMTAPQTVQFSPAGQPTATTSAAVTPPAASSFSSAAVAPAPQVAAPGVPEPLPQNATTGENVRVAQSTDGNIYAFDTDNRLAFRFDPGGAGPTPIQPNEIAADVQERLTAPGAGGSSTNIDMGALEEQSAQARAALSAQSTDQRRPPINALLSQPEITEQIVSSLDQAQGITVPAVGQEAEEPVIYAFFDPQCPFCHQAYDGLTGRFTIKWMPLSVLGPNGDRLHALVMGDVDVIETTVDGQQLNSAPLPDDPDRVARLERIMTTRDFVPRAELSEGQRFILDENAELFRLLSQGAEELRAVPSFFIRGTEGEAVWLRGYDPATPDLIAGIVNGQGG